jgi:hypothetical protein
VRGARSRIARAGRGAETQDGGRGKGLSSPRSAPSIPSSFSVSIRSVGWSSEYSTLLRVQYTVPHCAHRRQAPGRSLCLEATEYVKKVTTSKLYCSSGPNQNKARCDTHTTAVAQCGSWPRPRRQRINPQMANPMTNRAPHSPEEQCTSLLIYELVTVRMPRPVLVWSPPAPRNCG